MPSFIKSQDVCQFFFAIFNSCHLIHILIIPFFGSHMHSTVVTLAICYQENVLLKFKIYCETYLACANTLFLENACLYL